MKEFLFSILCIALLYSILAVTNFIMQLCFSTLYYLKSKNNYSKVYLPIIKRYTKLKTIPETTIVYPIYNENPKVLDRVLKSVILSLNAYTGLKVVLVDDGSTNREELMPIYNKYIHRNLKLILKQNEGKRHAQVTGWDGVKSKYIITVDSDTIINPKSIARLVAKMESEDNLGAVTGEVLVENRFTNILTYLISIRYSIAFNLERSAQSYFGSMLCCSGPLSIYRNSILQGLNERYISQKFLGGVCTYGDDRHLTNLVLSEGYNTEYMSQANCYTYVPENIGVYVTQQTRWNKSFYREFLWTLKAWNKISLYSLYDMIMQPVLFFLVTINLMVHLFGFAYFQDTKTLIYFGLVALFMSSLRGVFAIFSTKNPATVLFFLYTFIHFTILLPIRLKALLTLKDVAWGTRSKSNKVIKIIDFLGWFGLYYGLICLPVYGLINYLKSNFNVIDDKQFGRVWINNFNWQEIITQVQEVFMYSVPYMASLSIIFILIYGLNNLDNNRAFVGVSSVIFVIGCILLLIAGNTYSFSQKFDNRVISAGNTTKLVLRDNVVNNNNVENSKKDTTPVTQSNKAIAGVSISKGDVKPIAGYEITSDIAINKDSANIARSKLTDYLKKSQLY